MQPSRYERFDQKPFESRYMYEETIIDYSVEKVWPHALNIKGWMSDHRLETLEGKPGKVGHFERVYPAEGVGAEVPLAPYHLYGVAEIIPFKLIVLEVFSEIGGSYSSAREMIVFDAILLTDLGKKTNFAVLAIDTWMGSKQEKGKHTEELCFDEKVMRARLKRYFENLKQLVKNGEASTSKAARK